jgi:alpha-tubulin suppressor-like RCC1 family protein
VLGRRTGVFIHCACAIAGVVTSACEPDPHDLRWRFVFDSSASATRAVAVEGTVLEGGCTSSAVRFRATGTRTSMPPLAPPLGPGRYGFAGSARDAACIDFARGCVEVELPLEPGSEVVVTLVATTESAACPPDECTAGACGSPDAGTRDAGRIDAGEPRDAGMIDAACACDACETCSAGTCVPAPDDTACAGGICHDGACCTGCWDGATCQPGTAAAACGAAGRACTACECAGDACTAGACEVGRPIDAVAAGGAFTCAIASGELWCWGENSQGQIGTGAFGADVLAPMRVGTASEWSAVGTGDDHVCAVRDGELHCWGDSSDGQLGLGTMIRMATPQRVGMLTNWAQPEGASVGDMSCAIHTDGSAECFGQNNFGQLGVGDLMPRLVPTPIAGSYRVIAIAHHTSFGIGTTGALFAWGRNHMGQLGAGDMVDRSSPTQLGAMTDWTAVGAGDVHACAIRAGQLHCWGANVSGQLGTGGTTASTSPVRVGMESDWVQVEGGLNHTCGRRMDGSLWCWGDNTNGEIGAGVVGATMPSPTRVGAASDYTDLTVGGNHSCAVRSSGAIECFGSSSNGQLGQGDRLTHPSPARVCF